MDIISRKYINEGFNSKAYIINDDYILLDGVNQNSYKNYQKYVNVINQISNVKSLEIPRIIELIEPCEEYPNGALIYKMIKGHTFRKEHIEIVNLDNIAKKLAEFISEASNPVPTPLLGHRCRSSQEITGSPTPFSTSNHYLWICASASFSLSNPNIAA